MRDAIEFVIGLGVGLFSLAASFPASIQEFMHHDVVTLGDLLIKGMRSVSVRG